MNDPGLIACFLIAIIVLACLLLFISVWQVRGTRRTRLVENSLRELIAEDSAVTVLLYAHNDESNIISSLEILTAMEYTNYDVVAIDDASIDDTKKLMRDFQKEYAPSNLAILSRRERTSINRTLQAGYRKSEHAKIVLIVRSDMMIDRYSIERELSPLHNQIRGDRWSGIIPIDEPALLRITHLIEKTYWRADYVPILIPITNLSKGFAGLYGRLCVRRIISIFGVLLTLAIAILSMVFFGISAIWYAWVLLMFYGFTMAILAPTLTINERLLLIYCLPVAPFLLLAGTSIEAAVRLIAKISYM